MGKRSELALTERERELLEALARCVRVFSVEQIRRTWWSTVQHGERAVLARLRVLESNAYINLDRALTHPELPLRAPLIAWPGDGQTPDFGKVAYALKARWKDVPRAERIVTIAPGIAAQFGGYPSPPLRLDEITHDLHLAAVYLFYREHFPALARDWISERVIRRTRPVRGGPIPDAMIRGASQRVIEFGGAYSKQRVRIFHAFCLARGFPYELW